MNDDEIAVFHCLASCEISTYTTLYGPKKVVVSTGNIAQQLSWSKYRTRKAIHTLVDKGLIERASCGNPAVEGGYEYRELIYEAAPPTNGYAITDKGFQTTEWKKAYDDWCKSMDEWVNSVLEKGEIK